MEIDYFTTNITKNEKLSININGEERCKTFYYYHSQLFLDSIRENTIGKEHSLIKFYLEPKMHKVEISFESAG